MFHRDSKAIQTVLCLLPIHGNPCLFGHLESCMGLCGHKPDPARILLMTLVRKGIISARGYHMAYTVSLCMPFVVGARSVGAAFVPFLGLGWLLYQLRRKGVNPPAPGSSQCHFLPRTEKQDRFDRTAPVSAEIDLPCLLTIHNKTYDLSSWAKAHPGGVKVLQRFHGKDATKAFDGAGHSRAAYEMLKDFEVVTDSNDQGTFNENDRQQSLDIPIKKARWRAKLFTKEDPIGIHKYAGVFVLLHYIFRYSQLYFGDPSAGFGTRLGKGVSITAPLCLIPHVVLSLSSLIFHTVPRERVVGKPMIWSELRVHSIVFACRSAVVTFLAWLSVAKNHAPGWPQFCVTASALSVLATSLAADEATRRLRVHESRVPPPPCHTGQGVPSRLRSDSNTFMRTVSSSRPWPVWPLGTPPLDWR
ncbi:hypothetical protein MHU86_15374 [Fragilaria crotonensis]|nr:hypothetical protein MHU86_15374 [Fragilaria crotonensis]